MALTNLQQDVRIEALIYAYSLEIGTPLYFILLFLRSHLSLKLPSTLESRA